MQSEQQLQFIRDQTSLSKENSSASEKECGKLISLYSGGTRTCPNKIPYPIVYHSGESSEPQDWMEEEREAWKVFINSDKTHRLASQNG